MAVFLLVSFALFATAHAEPVDQCEQTGQCSEKTSSLMQRQVHREVSADILSEEGASDAPLLKLLETLTQTPPVPPIMVPNVSLAEVKGGDCGTHDLLYEGLEVKAPLWLWTWYYYDSTTHTAQKCGDDCAKAGCASFIYEEYIPPSSAAGTAWCYMFFDEKSDCMAACEDTSVNHVCDFQGRTVSRKTPSNACGNGHHGGSYGFKDSTDLCRHTGPNGVCGNGIVWDPATWKWPRSQFIGHGQKFTSCTPNGAGSGGDTTEPTPSDSPSSSAPIVDFCVELSGFNTGYVFDGVYKVAAEKNGKFVFVNDGTVNQGHSWVVWWNPSHQSHIYGYHYLSHYAAWEIGHMDVRTTTPWVYSFGNPDGKETAQANNVFMGAPEGSESLPIHGRGNNYWHVTTTGTVKVHRDASVCGQNFVSEAMDDDAWQQRLVGAKDCTTCTAL